VVIRKAAATQGYRSGLYGPLNGEPGIAVTFAAIQSTTSPVSDGRSTERPNAMSDASAMLCFFLDYFF
jgi:hypothetical protein